MWKENFYGYPNMWVQGKEEICEKTTICIAGSREPLQENALSDSHVLGNLIGQNKDTVLVSGLARGIDIESLRGFYLGKRTIGEEGNPFMIGCIGTSPDSVYPRENQRLQELLKNQHLLLSLVEPGVRTNKYHFLERNRLMARLSKVIYIMSCTETSGCHSLLEEALKLKKKVIMSEHNVNLSWARRIVSKAENLYGSCDFQVWDHQQIIERAKEQYGTAIP